MIRSRTKFLLTTGILATLTFASSPALAVSDAEFAALKEQMMLFSRQLERLEGEQTTLRLENAELKQQNQQLKMQNQALAETAQAAPPATPAIVVPAASEATYEASNAQIASAVEPAAGNPAAPAPAPHKDSVLIPGTDTRLKFGGYVKLDAIHDFNMTRSGSGEDFGLYAAIPLDGSTEDEKGANTRLHARQTRLNVTATTPTDHGDLKVFVEGDFYGTGGSQTSTNATAFALRHAYGELGNVLIGQTWSNYMDLAAYPESIDFQGVSGNTLLRQGQIRYTHKPSGSKNTYSIAIENPASDVLSAPANPGTDSGVENVPDLTAKARFVGDNGEISLKAVARKIEAFSSTGGNSDSEFGYAVGLSGKLNVGKKDDFRFQVGYGDGIGRYIYDLAAASQAAGFNSSADTLETVEAIGGYAAYRHWWNDKTRTNIIAGTTQVLDNPSFLAPASTNESVMSAHGNLIWSVTDKVDLGGEYIYGHRETESGAGGTLHRAQFSAIYKF